MSRTEPGWMRWITFFILLGLMTALQVSKLCAIPYRITEDWSQWGYWPQVEYLLILAIFYALYAGEGAAPLCGLICGVMYDLQGDSFVGTTAVPLALVCLGIVKIRLSLFREHAVSQLLVTLLAVLAFACLATVFQWAIGGELYGQSVVKQVGRMSGNAVYTSVAAPFFFALFLRFQNLLGFSSHGPRSRAQY